MRISAGRFLLLLLLVVASPACTPTGGGGVEGQMTVGPVGGTLHTRSGLVIEVPPGALSETITLKASLLALDGGALRNISLDSPLYRLEPDGYSFSIPILLHWPPSTELPGAGQEQVVLTLGDDHGAPYVFPVPFDARRNTASVSHLSTYAKAMTPVPTGKTVDECVARSAFCSTRCVQGLSDEVRAHYAAAIELVQIGPPQLELADVPEPYLSTSAAASLSRVASIDAGPRPALQIIAALRTLDAQYVLKKLPCGQAASPGFSNHGRGKAIDIGGCSKSAGASGQTGSCLSWSNSLVDAGWSWGARFTTPDVPHFSFGSSGPLSAPDPEVVGAFVRLWQRNYRCDEGMAGAPDIAVVVSRIGYALTSGYKDLPPDSPSPSFTADGNFCCADKLCGAQDECLFCDGGVTACSPAGYVCCGSTPSSPATCCGGTTVCKPPGTCLAGRCVNPDDLTGTWSGTWQWMTCPQRAPVLCVPGAPQSDLSIVISQNFGGGVSGTFFSGGIGAFNGTYLPDAGLTPDIPFGGGLSLVFQLDSTRIDVCQAGVSGTTRGSTLAGTCNASWTAYGNDVASYTIQATKQ